MLRILILDDDLDCSIFLKKCLEEKGHIARHILTKGAIPYIIDEFNPQIIIADILHLHYINSECLIKVSKQTPIILLSGCTFNYIETTLHIYGVVQKPFNFDLLENRIQELFK